MKFMKSIQWFSVFLNICLHQALPELHNTHDSFSRLYSLRRFAKSFPVHFCPCVRIRKMHEKHNLPSVSLYFC